MSVRESEVDDCPRCGDLFELAMASYCKENEEVAICHECGMQEIFEDGVFMPKWTGEKYWEKTS